LNWLRLERGSVRPLYQQVAEQVRQAILAGDLAGGTPLPSSRALAADLAVSRVTAIQAYDVLIAEGLVETRRGAGTRVVPHLTDEQLQEESRWRQESLVPIDASKKHVQKLYALREPSQVAFQPGIPAFDGFPRTLWSRLLMRQALSGDPNLLDYAHVGGYAPLRHEIADYLRSSRSVRCDPEQVIIVSSVRSAIAAVCAVLWPSGSKVAVGRPGYMVAERVLKASGNEVLGVPVDEEGLQVERLRANSESCAGAYLTPAHHWPTGVSLSPARRDSLIEWAVATGAWLIEDDYDSEFRFGSPPLAPLYASGAGRVIYMGTFSKTFAPSLRTAYLVVPKREVERFEEHVWLSATEPPLHVQAALADLMSEGHFTLHISRMRKLYERRRTLLIDSLESILGDRVRVVAPPGGLQIIALLPDHIPAIDVSQRAHAMDVVARTLASYDYPHKAPNGLQLGFAAVPEDQIETNVRLLADIIGAWA
jgi:GntR family transcriptional regulator/MocR family aminotransferase